jgi:plastocyanin
MRARSLALAGLLLVASGLAACGDDDDAADTSSTSNTEVSTPVDDGSTGEDAPVEGGDEVPADEGSDIVVAEDFSLTNGAAAPGARVTFDNQGEVPHTLTADDGAFDTGTVEPGGTGDITAPSAPGAYPYHCEIHPAMTGTLTVA